MSPKNFCYWLRGYIEENNTGLTSDQLKKVSEHLSLALQEFPRIDVGKGLLMSNSPLEIDPKFASMYSDGPKNMDLKGTMEISPGVGLRAGDNSLTNDTSKYVVNLCSAEGKP